MVNGSALHDAIKLAKENPRLGVGLHLVLVRGASTLSKETIPDLVDKDGFFSSAPVRAGFAYFFKKKLRHQLYLEIKAQVEKFKATGLKMDHLNGHLHIHMQPIVFKIILENMEEWGINAIRITKDPFLLNAKIMPGNWIPRIIYAIVFNCLSAWCCYKIKGRNIKVTENVFGLLQNANVNKQYVINLLKNLKEGIYELYSHPSWGESACEVDALKDGEVIELVKTRNIELIRYQDI